MKNLYLFDFFISQYICNEEFFANLHFFLERFFFVVSMDNGEEQICSNIAEDILRRYFEYRKEQRNIERQHIDFAISDDEIIYLFVSKACEEGFSEYDDWLFNVILSYFLKLNPAQIKKVKNAGKNSAYYLAFFLLHPDVNNCSLKEAKNYCNCC